MIVPTKSKVRFQNMQLPVAWDAARAVIDESIRELRSVLDGGFRWREQVRFIVELTVDPSAFPIAVDVPGLKSEPVTVQVLRAVELRGASDVVISGGAVLWNHRGGKLHIYEVSELSAGTRYTLTLAVME